MKPSKLVFIAAFAMSLCFINQLLQGRAALAVAALSVTCGRSIFAHVFGLLLSPIT
jgi:hypothetical protein